VVLSDGVMIGSGVPGEAVRIFRERLMEAGDELSLGAAEELAVPEPPPPAPPAPAVLPASIRVSGDEVSAGTADHARPVRLTEVLAFYPEVNERRYLLPGETLIVRVGFTATVATEQVALSIDVRLDDGSVLFRTDTDILGLSYDAPVGPSAIDFHFEGLPLFDGTYDVCVGVTGPGGILFDWREPACQFEVMNPGRSVGLVDLPVRLAIVPREWVGGGGEDGVAVEMPA
jgi:hypothetical protein